MKRNGYIFLLSSLIILLSSPIYIAGNEGVKWIGDTSDPYFSFDRDLDRIDDRIDLDGEFPMWTLIHVDDRENIERIKGNLEDLCCRLGPTLKYVPVIFCMFMDGRSMREAADFPHLEVIEEDSEVIFAIDTSVKAMKVEPSLVYSPNTAHELGYRGEGMTIAVLDLGIDNDHPVLGGSFVAGIDFTLPDSPLSPRDGSYDPDDKGGHGETFGCPGHYYCDPVIPPHITKSVSDHFCWNYVSDAPYQQDQAPDQDQNDIQH